MKPLLLTDFKPGTNIIIDEPTARRFAVKNIEPEIHNGRFPAECWEIGDIVTRDGNDEQEILSFSDDRFQIEVRCTKEPPCYDGASEPWCRIGDVEWNLTRRYDFVRSKNSKEDHR